MNYSKEQIFKKYFLAVEFLFFCFLFFTLSFGRAFSILHINTPLVPLFVTELMLIVSMPLVAAGLKNIHILSKKFIIPLLIYFLLGCIYLFFGLLDNNLFVLRDIVLCGYILFFLMTFFIFSNKIKLRLFLYILLFGNVINLLVGKFFILNVYPLTVIKNFLYQTKPTNLGLYYGITLSFLIAFFPLAKRNCFKFFIILLLTLNFYMCLIIGQRTLWVSCLFLFMYFFFILRTKFIKIIFTSMPIAILVFAFLFFLDFEILKTKIKEPLVSKAKSLSTALIDPSGSKEFVRYNVKISSGKESNSAPKPTFDTYSEKYIENLGNIIWRFEVWKQAIGFGLHSPILGMGFGRYPPYELWDYNVAEPKRIDINSGLLPTHNHLITIFYKMGIFGLSLFLFLNIYIFSHGLKYLRKCQSEFIRCFLIALLGGFVFWHSMALFFDVIDSPPTSILLWVIAGLFFGAVETDKKYTKSEELKK